MTKLRESDLITRIRELFPGGEVLTDECKTRSASFTLPLAPVVPAGTSPLLLYDGKGLVPLQDLSFNHFEIS